MFVCALLAAACGLSGGASAQSFPGKPIRMVVGFAPGGPADVMARLIGQRISGTLGQSIVIGTPPHLIGEMFKQRLGLDVVHVPYKGGGLSTQAVVAGETQFSFENPAASLPLVQAGNVRGLASTSETRGAQTPDLPTMIEAGVPEFTSVSLTAVAAA